ncbi:LLM class flavin-dependent oxidoreductase [Microbacterium sp. NPDC055683]
MAIPRLIGIDLSGEGAHPAAWRAARHEPAAALAPARLRARLQAVERAGYAFAVLPDGPGDPAPGVQARLDAIELAAFAGAVTSRIGLVPVAGIRHAEPFHLANQLSSLDLGSHGRAGWIARVVDDDALSGAYGRARATSDDALVAEAADVVRAVRLLWDTWEDDALVADIAQQRFLDIDRWHHADFVGETFSVRGPGLLPRPPQGQLVVWADEHALSPRLSPLVDIAIVHGVDAEAIARAADAARERGIPRVIAAVEVLVDTRRASAAARLHALDAHTVWRAGRDARLVGTPAAVASGLADVLRHVDGVVVRPAVLDEDAAAIAEEVTEIVSETVPLRIPLSGETLREAFGLERPANVFAVRGDAHPAPAALSTAGSPV